MIESATVLAFSLFEIRSVCALILGSGISRAAPTPTGWGIALNLPTGRLGLVKGAKE